MISLTSYFTYSSPNSFIGPPDYFENSRQIPNLEITHWLFTLPTEHLFAYVTPSPPLLLSQWAGDIFKIATQPHILALFIPSRFTVLHSTYYYNLLAMPYNFLLFFFLSWIL